MQANSHQVFDQVPFNPFLKPALKLPEASPENSGSIDIDASLKESLQSSALHKPALINLVRENRIEQPFPPDYHRLAVSRISIDTERSPLCSPRSNPTSTAPKKISETCHHPYISLKWPPWAGYRSDHLPLWRGHPWHP